MSRSFKDQRKYKKKVFWHIWCESYREIHQHNWWMNQRNSDKEIKEFISKNKVFKNGQQLYTDYSGAPSWWTRMFSNIPKRRQEASYIRKLLVDNDLADSLLFPLARKPFSYYY